MKPVMKRKGKLLAHTDGQDAVRQHTGPCSDCPWRRDSLSGWLGAHTALQFAQAAHGEDRMDCHVLRGAQCAGGAIYRANVVKCPRDPELLRLPANRVKVFTSPVDFMAHHKDDE